MVGDSGAEYQPTGDITLYADWLPILYIVRFNANGGAGTMDDQALAYDLPMALSANQFTMDGGMFLGWSESPTGPVQWEDGGKPLNLTNVENAIVNLYAIWGTDPITVRFNSNWDQYTMTFDAGGDYGGWSKRFDAGASITPPTVVRENHNFLGWSPTPPETMPTHDVTCVAQWQQIPLTATITTNRNTATCSNVNPPDATVQYSKTNATSGYADGSTFTLDFTSGTTQTKNGWFKLSKSGVADTIYKVSIKQTASAIWTDWSGWLGPTTGKNIALYLLNLKNTYGEGNYEAEVIGDGSHMYARNRHIKTPVEYNTTYKATITRVS